MQLTIQIEDDLGVVLDKLAKREFRSRHRQAKMIMEKAIRAIQQAEFPEDSEVLKAKPELVTA